MRWMLVLVALFAMLIYLFPTSASAVRYPGPLDIPESRVLKMSCDAYIDAYAKKHHDDILEPETRAPCYYWAELHRDQNMRLAKRLPGSRRRLAHRCQNAFDDVMQACYDYEMEVEMCTMVEDFYASQEVSNQEMMRRLVRALRLGAHARRRARADAEDQYLSAWQELRGSYSLIGGDGTSVYTPKSEQLADYRKVKAALRKAKIVLNELPLSAKADFASQLADIVNNINLP